MRQITSASLGRTCRYEAVRPQWGPDRDFVARHVLLLELRLLWARNAYVFIPGAGLQDEIILEVRSPSCRVAGDRVWPHPAALSANAWNYLALFVAVIIALILEPLPPGAVGLLGMTLGMVLGYVAAKPADAIKWGLSGFSDGTVWLIFGSLVFATGYEKTGLGRRIALTLVR